MFQKICLADSKNYAILHRKTTEGDSRNHLKFSITNFLKNAVIGRKRTEENISQFWEQKQNRDEEKVLFQSLKKVLIEKGS